MFSARLIQLLDKLGQSGAAERLGARISAPEMKASSRPRFGRDATAEALERFWDGRPPEQRDTLADDAALAGSSAYTANIENMIGLAKVPIGIAGPLTVRGAEISMPDSTKGQLV